MAGYEELHHFLSVFLGVLTGGGGLLRDIMARQTPYILKNMFMPVASIAGECAILSCFPALINNDAAMMHQRCFSGLLSAFSHSLLLEPAKSVKEVLISFWTTLL